VRRVEGQPAPSGRSGGPPMRAAKGGAPGHKSGDGKRGAGGHGAKADQGTGTGTTTADLTTPMV